MLSCMWEESTIVSKRGTLLGIAVKANNNNFSLHAGEVSVGTKAIHLFFSNWGAFKLHRTFTMGEVKAHPSSSLARRDPSFGSRKKKG